MFSKFVTICAVLHGPGTNDFQFIHFLCIKQAQMQRIQVFSAGFSLNFLLQDSKNAFLSFFSPYWLLFQILRHRHYTSFALFS